MPEIRKHERTKKSQLGQFFTPEETAAKLIEPFQFTVDDVILEPGCGDGSFVFPLIEKLVLLYKGTFNARVTKVLENNIYAVEIDQKAYFSLLTKINERYGIDVSEIKHNIYRADFLLWKSKISFTHIIGNPPFGGTIDYDHQDALDKVYGRRDGLKIKKESYSFFIVKCLDHLCDGGEMRFICSDTFLTIKTMSGLRILLMKYGISVVEHVDFFSEETNYPMVVFDFCKSGESDHVTVDGNVVFREDMEVVGNFSWTIDPDVAEFFRGKKLSDYVVCSSGMTTGKNKYFVREIKDGSIEEPYDFEFYDDPITVKRELERARLNKLSPAKKKAVEEQEKQGETRRNVRITAKKNPESISLPHKDYLYYNMASSSLMHCEPTKVIYWKDDGDAVYTFKKNGNWYLYGVGGKPFFKKEGFTWPLIASRIHAHYLSSGYILDSGAPCGFLLDGVHPDELYFIIGWCASATATKFLKQYINHTKNIQGKDVEKLPYPSWVDRKQKQKVIDLVKSLVAKKTTIVQGSSEVCCLNEIFHLNI